ncbi:calcium-translocating P-type ATPase, PMCA-type [Anaerosacchariphilus polymeriproducens]|uniref:P-type Ca(2+) transporter n=1 Tax=Anaerosacchariphilus polymeriproducens TaxID=1812858 RepID=A0A371ASV0_9FIRM|nr:calcium-translocating P-type ATPase, PMCA-type [Anaerosacchariphilus polymeriproducens]RDU22645.1 calcium-translocating P-type ATPase, PMCA-type [Anaerosacchariphilus polymeriproducens]
MKFYCTETEDVFKAVNSNENGLTTSEAEKRLEVNGKNKLKEGKKVSTMERFLNQLKDPMIIILIAAAVISGITAAYSGEGFADVVIIMIVVIINAVLGVYQESKAEKAIEALQEMAAATSKVLRNGQIEVVKSEDIVVGDIVLLEAGDAVPADGRIIESASMKIEESALTGESVPVNKIMEILNLNDASDIPLGDRKNMVYMGSTVVYGRGKVVITGTGMDTEMGKIADAIAQAEEGQTPLQIKLAGLSKILSYLVIGICAFIFIFSLIRSGDLHANVILNTFMVAVSLAVAAIPEGLAMVVTVVLSIGVTNMSKRNAIIRRLTAVETLGCAEIICSDKTGTLTQNKMTVVEHYSEDEKLLATAMALCCDAELDSDNQATGEPTECALVNFAYANGLPKPQLKEKAPRIGEAPFDSMRKMMSTVHKTEQGIVQYTKGAPDEVLKLCTSYLKDGQILPLDEKTREQILKENKNMAQKALRVLCAAQKTYEKEPENYEVSTLEKDLTFLGLTGMIDPIRPEVKDAIDECKTAGISAIMITGDHKDTAVAIANQLGILKSEEQAITGSQLDSISDAELEKSIQSYRVYARVQPEHKVRIVNAWRKNGCITAMTGDGVNDAPSIKSADIGVGMGITGTDVTKNVADMVLADDNFATIVGAVEEGRKIYDNIRKAIQFLLASNMSEVLSIFFATLFGFVILHPVHLLWINLITDCFPALALGMEDSDADIMDRKPRSSKDGIFSGGVGFDVVYQGIIVTVLTLAAYFVGHKMESGVWEITQSADGITMAFLTLSFAEIFHSFNMRSQRGSIFKITKQNKFLWIASIASLILTTAVIYVPFLAKAFEFEHINLMEYAVAVLIAASIIPIVEIVKLIQRTMEKDK